MGKKYKHLHTTLDADDVRHIYKLKQDGRANTDIAARFNISDMSVAVVLNTDKWNVRQAKAWGSIVDSKPEPVKKLGLMEQVRMFDRAKSTLESNLSELSNKIDESMFNLMVDELVDVIADWKR